MDISVQDQLLENCDSKGRPLLHTMSKDEKLDEMLLILRTLTDILEQLGQNPMVGMMVPSLVPSLVH